MTPAVRDAVVEFAPAKINLFLHLLGRRADGYHELESLVVFADLGDELRAEPAKGLALAAEGPFATGLPASDDNLVLRAARALAEAARVPANARLALTKRLPVASGIGGGSADAAAALRALVKLWRATIDPAALDALALKLGADVPVCLRGAASLVGGIGEKIAPAPALPNVWLTLVNPGLPLATKDVFARRAGAFAPAMPMAEAPRDPAALAAALRARRNDLAEPALALMPAIGDVLAALEAQPGSLLARLSGSGPTCFGLFAAQAQASAAAAKIAAAKPGWWCAAARLRA